MRPASQSIVPRWPYFARLLLVALSDGTIHHRRQVVEAVLQASGLTAEQMAETIPGKNDLRAPDTISWALHHLNRADTVARPARAMFQITDAGRRLLAEYPDTIPKSAIETLPAYSEFSTEPTIAQVTEPNAPSSPTDMIESGIGEIDESVATELIRRLREQTPLFFERALVEVLKGMGYGGVDREVLHIGGHGDGGVDGVINQDPLGLSRIYVQAKRYSKENTVGRPEIQGFVGALTGKGASQGVFMTTSTFSAGAREYAESLQQQRVVLVDGQHLAQLMIRYRVGVQVKDTYTVVEVDEDFFE